MIEIFKFISSLMAKIVVKWQSISLGGFRPFWYLFGISLLTIFGFFFRGLLFGGAGGGAGSSIASRADKKSKSSNGSRVVIYKSKK
jgi:hypothetical protein